VQQAVSGQPSAECWVEPSPAATSGASARPSGEWAGSLSRFLTDRTEAERAYALAEQLGSVNAAARQRSGQPVIPTLDPVFVGSSQLRV
jgi:hypothetical protein